MSRPLAVGLIIFFILVIAASAIWLIVRPQPAAVPEPTTTVTRRFPFGFFGIPAREAPTLAATTTPALAGEAPKEILTLLSAEPIAGFGVASGTVRYIERQTGHVYDIGPQGENKNRVSNTTIPKIFDARWSQDTSRALLRYIENESVRAVSVDFSASSTRAVPLSSSLLSSAFSPALPQKILYFIPADDGGRAITADPDNSKQTEILAAPFPDFLVAWPDKNTLSFATRPSGNVPGFLFTYDIPTKRFLKLLGDIPGFEVLWSPSGKRLLYSRFDARTQIPALASYDLKTKITDDLGASTLASKCAFSANNETIIYCGADPLPRTGLYPDDWLQGAASFNDRLWQFNLTTLEKTSLPATRTPDVLNPQTSPDGKFLYFIDKKNNSLWSYKIAN